jgi:hypothetical protein
MSDKKVSRKLDPVEASLIDSIREGNYSGAMQDLSEIIEAQEDEFDDDEEDDEDFEQEEGD